MATRSWRCVEHNKMVHGQAGLAFASTDEVDRFAAAVAEAEDYCTAWRRTSSPPPLEEQPSRVPVLIESESGDDMDCTFHAAASSGEDLLRKIDGHEATLQLHWTLLVSWPSRRSVTTFTSSLDAAIMTLLELSAFLSMSPLHPSPPTTMAAIYRALVMVICLHDFNTTMADRKHLNGYLRVMLWGLHGVARPQLEPLVLDQWNKFSTAAFDGVSNTTNSMVSVVSSALQPTSCTLTCAHVCNTVALLGPSTQKDSLVQFQQHFKAYVKSHVTFEFEWMTKHNRNRSPSAIHEPPSSPVATVATPNSPGRPSIPVNFVRAFSRGQPTTQPSRARPPPPHKNAPSHRQIPSDKAVPAAFPKMSSALEDVAAPSDTKDFEVTFSAGPLGLSLKPESSRIVVANVIPDSQAQRIGLIENGDMIVKVQNFPVTNDVSIIERFATSGSRPLHITFRRRIVVPK